jgi:copper oxidase (laccase) domain-containing protein
VATTSAGAPALDLRAGVAAALAEVDALPADPDPSAVRCTATDPGCFSWRARADRGRQAAVTWIEAA